MSTITAILEADADGAVHLVLPEALRHRRVKIQATVEAVEPDAESDKAPRPHFVASPEMLARRKAAMAEVRRLDPYRDIDDPVAWQREQRNGRRPA
jgi:hypothetical protein